MNTVGVPAAREAAVSRDATPMLLFVPSSLCWISLTRVEKRAHYKNTGNLLLLVYCEYRFRFLSFSIGRLVVLIIHYHREYLYRYFEIIYELSLFLFFLKLDDYIYIEKIS